MVAVEDRAGHDAATHGMYQFKHCIVVVKGIGPDSIVGKGLGGTASTLIEGGDKSGLGSDFFELFVTSSHGVGLFGFR